MQIKRFLASFLAAVLILGITACSAPCEHTYTETIEKEAAVLQDGIKKFTCEKCSHSYTEAIPATKSLKILAFGNSFMDDAMAHFWDICKAGGVEEIVIADLHIGGCDLNTHWYNMKTNPAAYIYFKNSTGVWTEERNKKPLDALAEEDWDIIMLHGASRDSGTPSTFRRLGAMIELIREHVPADVKFWWNMTWAYQTGWESPWFEVYNNDQAAMYQAIVTSVQEQVMTQPEISGMVPSGTAIQNLRTTYLGDNVTRDGYHLNRQFASYAVGLAWYAGILGGDIETLDWAPLGVTHNEKLVQACKESAINAIANPYAVTESKIK